jgi:lysyl endopeptidase
MRLTTHVALASLLLLAAGDRTLADGPKTIGAFEPLSITATPSLAKTGQQTIRFPGATYVRLHFASFRLAEGDWLEIASPDGRYSQVYSGNGLNGRGTFWATTVPGEAAVLTLHGRVGGDYGFSIDGAGRGTADVFGLLSEPSIPGSICGATDWKDPACYQTTFPDEVEAARAVAWAVVDCCELCNAFKVSGSGQFLSDYNCQSPDPQDTELWFEMRATECGGSEVTLASATRGLNVVAADPDLDYVLFTTMGPTESVPCLELDRHQAHVGERVYIPHHPTGVSQKLSIESDVDPSGFCTVLDPAAANPYTTRHTEVSHHCDTGHGSLGAPVISGETGKVLGIQHLGNCPTANSAVRSDLIYKKISRVLHSCSIAPYCEIVNGGKCDCDGICSSKEQKFVNGGGVCYDCP